MTESNSLFCTIFIALKTFGSRDLISRVWAPMIIAQYQESLMNLIKSKNCVFLLRHYWIFTKCMFSKIGKNTS